MSRLTIRQINEALSTLNLCDGNENLKALLKNCIDSMLKRKMSYIELPKDNPIYSLIEDLSSMHKEMINLQRGRR